MSMPSFFSSPRKIKDHIKIDAANSSYASKAYCSIRFSLTGEWSKCCICAMNLVPALLRHSPTVFAEIVRPRSPEMKYVWILNHYAMTPDQAGGTRHYSLAKNLLPCGWHATLIASSVEHNSGSQRLAPQEVSRMEEFAGIPFLWLRTPQSKGNGIGRIINMLSYALRVLKGKHTQGLPRPDLIIGSTVHPFAAIAGALLARRHHVPFIFEVRDLWPQTLIDLGRLQPGSMVAHVLGRLEKWLYREASRVVVLLPHAAHYIEALGIPAAKVVWIPNGVDLSVFPACDAALKTAGKPFVLMYFGAHGQANGLECILEAMQLVSRQIAPELITLRMIGDGPLKADLIGLAQRLGLSNVSFYPSVPKDAIPALAGDADAFVISVLDLPRLYRYGISMNKLFDYLASARPIIIASAAANNPVADAKAGITVAPGNPEQIAMAILQLFNSSADERKQMGRAGRRYVELHHGFDQLARRLAATMDDCLSQCKQE
jgi:glycosyltransferase involved in cell wall biosynthesis